MAGGVTIPVWVFVAGWSVGGYFAAIRLQAAVMRADLVGRPTLALRVIHLHAVLKWGLLALVVIATGPLVWLTIARELVTELVAWARRAAARKGNTDA